MLIAFFCLNGFIVSGQYIFNNTTGDGLWSTATNWSTGTVPPNLIPNGTTVTIAANCTYNDIYAFGIHGIFTINPSVTFNLINGNDFVVYADGILNHNGTITAGILANLGTINVGGTVANPGTFTMPTLFDNRSTGIININDYGTVKLPPINPANPGATNINSGVININSGGNLEIRQASFTALPGVVNQNSGSTVTVGAASSYILTSNLTLPLGRKIDILGSMTINSGITLTNDGTIGVHTLTNNGTLINNGEMPNNNNGRITNNSTLSGTGSQDCALTNNGFFYPGGSNTVGCYRFNTPSSASLAAGTTVMDITGTDVCTSQDQVVQVGTAYPGGVLNLRFGSYIPPYGTTFQIFRVTGGTTYFGNFSAVNVSPSTSNILVSYDQYTGLITIVDPCPPPTTVTVDYQTLGANTADILWQQIIGATGYELQYKKSSVATWSPSIATPNYSQGLSNLEARTDYDVRVRTSCNNGTSYSSWSAVSTFTTAHGTVRNGNWSEATTWANNQVPTENDPAFVAHVVTVNTATAACLRLNVGSGTINIATNNALTVGGINLAQNTGSNSLAYFYSSQLNLTGGTLNVGGQLSIGENSTLHIESGTVNINGGGNPQFQSFGIQTASLFIADNATTAITGGTIHIYPNGDYPAVIETNKDFGNFTTCVGATVILEAGGGFNPGRYTLGNTNATTNITYHPRFYNLILRGATTITTMSGITVRNNITVDAGTLNITTASTFGTLTEVNSTITGTHTETGACSTGPVVITSITDGDWTDAATWSLTRVPLATDNVIIANIVTHGSIASGTEAHCHDLTISSSGRLNQNNLLIIDGNLTIQQNGAFFQNSTEASSLATTQIGGDRRTSAAGTRLITVSGTLSVGSSFYNPNFILAGRMVFNSGSTLNLGEQSVVLLTGWSGTNLEYLMDIDHLSTLVLNQYARVIVVGTGNSQKILSTERAFTKTTTNCGPYSSELLVLEGTSRNIYFGNRASSERQVITRININTSNNVYIENALIETYNSFSNTYSTNGQYGNLIAGGTLFGDYTLVNYCTNTSPLFIFDATTNNAVSLTFNATDSTVIWLPRGTRSFSGTFTAQSGKISVQGGILDLQFATISGLNSTKYFVTSRDIYDVLGYIRMATPNGVNKKIDIGINIQPSPTKIYTPLSITAHSDNANATVSAEMFTPPTNYLAPNVKWTVQSTATSADIAFSWQASLMSNAFVSNISNAKVYRLDGATWTELSSSTFSFVGDTYTMSAAGVTTFGTFAIMAVAPPSVIVSAQSGDWLTPSTWVDGNVPTATDDVEIAHTVTHQAANFAYAYCKNLTIRNSGVLNQKNTLTIAGDLTINGSFNNNPNDDPYPSVQTFMYTGFVAGTRLVTNNGTLRLGGSNNGSTSFILAGRMLLNSGSSFVMGTYGTLRLLGWSDPTPQYLMDISDFANLSLGTGSIGVNGNSVGNTKQAISPNRYFSDACDATGTIKQTLTLYGNATPYHYFGSSTGARQGLKSITINPNSPTAAPNVSFTNTLVQSLTTGNGLINSTDGQYGDMYLGNGATLNGDYTVGFKCNLVKPKVYLTSEFTTNSSTDFRINVANYNDYATINIAQTLGTKAFNGLFTGQNGHVVVKGGTLDLQNATVSGFGIFNYFMTQMGDEVGYSGGVGKVSMATTLGVAKRFELGLNVPTTTDNFYTPLSITPNSATTTNATVSAQPFTAPAGYNAPNVKWTVESAAASPDMNITFTWHYQLNSISYNNSILNGGGVPKIYRLDGATWVEVPSSTVTLSGSANSLQSITASNLTTLGTFAVMTSALPTPSVIQATTNPPYCQGGSVTLTGNVGGVWSTGATTSSITVTTSGNYSVTNTNASGSVTSNILNITFNALPSCTITGNTTFCTGQSTQLCVSLGATNYLWNTGATSNCISANAAGTYSVTVTANGCSSPCSQTVTIDCPITTITSKQTGVWTDASTWQGDVVPTASNNVIIRTQDAVTANVSGGDCRNLTVNGTLSVLGSLNVEDGSSDAANYNKLVLVNGALNLSSGSMVIKGRLQFGTGSSFAMGQDSHLTINSTGTTAANSITTQPLIDASGLTSMNVADGSTLSFGVVHPNLTEPIIKGNFDFRTTACSGSTTIEFADSPNATLRFGTDGTTQRFYDFTSIGTSSKNFVFTNTIIERFATISGGTITGTNCKINGLSLANATLNGSFELFTNCESREPFFEQAGSIVTNASNFNLKINAIGNAYFYLSNIYGNLNLLGTLNVFSGKVFLESGTLNLANATLTGTSGSNYFLTQPSSYVNLAVSNGVAKTFDVGRRDNFAATNAYTPLSIVSNTTTTSAVAVNTQTFTAPTGYLAPNVQWTIQSTEFLSSPNMSITFSWPTSIESGGFTTNRSNAKVYRYNGSTWVELSSSIVTTALGISSITAPNVTTLGLFAVMTPRVAATITSLQNGNWNQTTTWDFGVPTAIDNVIIAHTVRNNNPNSPYSCNNLTINDNATLDQAGRLIIGGNLTINGTFNHNPYTDPSAVSTEIGARRIGGIYGTNATEPAGKHLVTVSGTLALGGSTFDCGMALAGRIVFNGGSTFSMSYASTLTLTGWADPNDATPQYLMDIDRLGTADLYNSQSSIIVTHSNGTQPVISTGKNFIESNCNFYNPTLTNVGFTLLDNTTQYFGGATQRQMNAIVMGSNTTLNLMNTTLRLLSARNGGSVYSSGGQFSSLTAGNGTTLYGDYTLVDHCFTQYPLVYFTNIGNLSFDNSMTLNINVTKEALLYIPNGVTQNLYGTFNFQNGKAVVLGGTLDLRNATAINGFSPTRYFETRRGENLSGINVSYTGLGAVLLPVAVNDVTPVTFSLGVTIPNGGSPRSVYAPVSILAPSSTNSSPSNVSVSLEPLTVPSGFVAPTVKWEITPSGSPTLSITFRWTAASESYSFSVNRSRARVYHYNTGTSVWAQLNSGAVTGPDADGLYSLTVTGVTNFSPFAVMIPTSALSAELVNFTAKNEGQKAQLTWQTASEINVKNFDVEKSLDGKTFDKISETKANNTPSVYSAFDNDFTASAYYRLKINDLDGTTRFSKIVYLDKNNDKGIKISRNTEGSILIETDDKIELITVSNTVGQVVKTTKDKQLLINDLTAGIYIISVKTDKGFLSQKVFKER